METTLLFFGDAHGLRDASQARPRPLTEEEKRSIKLIRVRSGLSQTEFASRVGTSQSMLSRYETGASNIPEDILVRIMTFSKDD